VDTKAWQLKALVQYVATHTFESWTTKKADELHIEAFKMNFMREAGRIARYCFSAAEKVTD